MIRHKPSEKMPESGKFVVIELVSPCDGMNQFSQEWHLGCYKQPADVWKVWQAYGLQDGPGFFGTSKVEWWADPMEEG